MVLIGLVGPRKSGKQELANHLVKSHGFKQLFVGQNQFKSFKDAIHFATKRWQEAFVIIGIDRFPDFEVGLKRPFFILVCIEAPVLIRFMRSKQVDLAQDERDELTLCDLDINNKPISNLDGLEAFLRADEKDLYSKKDQMQFSLYDFIQKAAISVFNDSNSLAALWTKVDELDLLNPDLIRPNWYLKFYDKGYIFHGSLRIGIETE